MSTAACANAPPPLGNLACNNFALFPNIICSGIEWYRLREWKKEKQSIPVSTACCLLSLEKAIAYREWWLAASVNMTFWLASLWKASSVFPRRCHYKVSLYCHTVHRRTRPGLWMKLAARDLTCNFSPAFFLMLKERGHDWEMRSPKYLSCILAYRALQFSWVSQTNSLSKLQKISDYWREKGRTAQCLRQHTKSPQMVMQVQSHTPVALLETWALFPVLPTNLLLDFTSLLLYCPRFSWNLEYYKLFLT